MKKVREFIDNLEKNPRGKSIAFFAFYFVFFLILLLFLRFGEKREYDSSNYESGVPYSYSLDKILKRNYAYSYDVTLDDEKNTYVGKKNGEKQSFSYKDKNYYFDGKQFFIDNGDLVEVENPFLFNELLDEENIGIILSASSYESKTSYESGREVYTFLISSNTINQLINDVSTDYFEEPNKIVISTLEDDNVEDIHFILDSYCQVNSLCEKSLDIRISYSNFGGIKKIEKKHS